MATPHRTYANGQITREEIDRGLREAGLRSLQHYEDERVLVVSTVEHDAKAVSRVAQALASLLDDDKPVVPFVHITLVLQTTPEVDKDHALCADLGEAAAWLVFYCHASLRELRIYTENNRVARAIAEEGGAPPRDAPLFPRIDQLYVRAPSADAIVLRLWTSALSHGINVGIENMPSDVRHHQAARQLLVSILNEAEDSSRVEWIAQQGASVELTELTCQQMIEDTNPPRTDVIRDRMPFVFIAHGVFRIHAPGAQHSRRMMGILDELARPLNTVLCVQESKERSPASQSTATQAPPSQSDDETASTGSLTTGSLLSAPCTPCAVAAHE